MAPDRGPGPISRWFEAWLRSMTYHQRGRRAGPEASTTIPEHPEPDEHVERVARLVGWLLGVLAPLLVCAGLVPFRETIDRSTAALVLVLPVVLVAVVGGPGPAGLSAGVSSLAFDVLLTRPYYRLRIHAAEDIEATVILLFVGFLVGQLVAREAHSRVRSVARGAEVAALLSMVRAVVSQDEETQLAERARSSLQNLLGLRECRWSPGYHGVAHPRLSRSGELLHAPAGVPERTPLPATGVELPVTAEGVELGRFILVPSGGRPTSREELLVAVAIADLFGLGLLRRQKA